MAGEATIGALRVVLGADTAKFEDNLKSAAGSLESFGRQITKIGAGVAIGEIFTKAFDKVVGSIEKAIDAGDKLSKASQKFGVPADELQVLAHAAELSDVSLEQLTGSLAKLSRSAIAAQGPTSDQAAAFRALGLSVSEIIKLSPDQAFAKIGDAVSKYGDGTGKTAAVQAIFGRGAADLIPLLNQGSAGLDDMRSSMQRLGQIIDGETLKAAEHFKDTLNDLGKSKDAIILKILGQSGLLDAMQRLATQFLESASSQDKFRDNFGVLIDFIKSSIDEFDRLGKAIEAAKAAVTSSSDSAAAGTKAWLGFEYGIEGVAEAAQKVTPAVITHGDSIAGLAKEYVDAAAGMKAAGDAAKAFAPQLNFSPEADKNLEAFNKEMKKLHDEALDASGIFAGVLAPGFLTTAQHLEYLKGQVTALDDGFLKLGPDAARLNQAMLVLQGVKIASEETLTNLDVFQQKMESLMAAFDAGQISQQKFVDAGDKLSQQFAVAWAQAASQTFGYIAGGFEALGKQSKDFLILSKAFNIAKATMDGFAAAVSAYNWGSTFGGPIGGAAAAALALAATAGYIAKIAATPFAKGGSFMVPGGMSGVDNQIVPLALSSGERVDITPAGQMRDGGRATTIDVTGMEDTALYSGLRLRNLVESLNRGHRDGYRLKIGER